MVSKANINSFVLLAPCSLSVQQTLFLSSIHSHCCSVTYPSQKLCPVREAQAGHSLFNAFIICDMLMGFSFLAYENEDQLLWHPGVLLESKVKEYLVETSLRTGNEKVLDRISSGTHTRDNEQVSFLLYSISR
jgi:hypothetical protein